MAKNEALIDFTAEQVALIKSQIAPKATDDELKLFLNQCKRTGLDPFARQIFCIHRKDGAKEKMSIQTSIDGFRVIAERSGNYGGQSAPVFEDVNGWPEKCTIAVYKFKGTTRYEAAVAVAFFKEYVQLKDEWIGGQRTGKKVVGDMWAKMPHTMLAKVAEALALRKAFPQDLSGLYTEDEMGQASNSHEPVPETEIMKQPAQLPSPTSVPFNPQYTQAPEPITAGQQKQRPAPQAPPAQATHDPFKQAYTDGQAIMAVLNTATTKEHVLTLYTANAALVDADQGLQAELKKRKLQLENGGKAIITDKQFEQVCDRVRKGDLEAAKSAANVFVLGETQKEELQNLAGLVAATNEAVTHKMNEVEDMLTVIRACTNEAQMNNLYKNNTLMIDRDSTVGKAYQQKYLSLKPAA